MSPAFTGRTCAWKTAWTGAVCVYFCSVFPVQSADVQAHSVFPGVKAPRHCPQQLGALDKRCPPAAAIIFSYGGKVCFFAYIPSASRAGRSAPDCQNNIPSVFAVADLEKLPRQRLVNTYPRGLS